MSVLTTIICSTILSNPQTPITHSNPPLQESLNEAQNIEGLLIKSPVSLEKQPSTHPNFRAYLGQVKVNNAITQLISVVVTNLDSIDPKPSPDQICDLHDRASRTRPGNAGQLFKSERTTINEKPMVVVMGSLIARDAAQNPANMYQTSAAFCSDKLAYEVNWLTQNGSEDFINAIKNVRSMSLKVDEGASTPKNLIGTSGNYTLLGIPFNFQLPQATTAIPSTKPSTEETGRYIGQISSPEWFASAEVSIQKSPVSDTSPKNLLRLLGYTEWAGLKPEFTLENGIYVCNGLSLNENRHARIDIAIKQNTIAALIVSTEKSKPLPDRQTLALTP